MNTDKYIALALSSPRGLKFRNDIDKAWPQWLQIVEDAHWLRNFRGSPLLRRATKAHTPNGVLVDEWTHYPHYPVADAIYATVVWGFGVERKDITDNYWYKTAMDMLSHWSKRPCISVYDSHLLKAPGVLPVMFRDLDNWLDTLWV